MDTIYFGPRLTGVPSSVKKSKGRTWDQDQSLLDNANFNKWYYNGTSKDLS